MDAPLKCALGMRMIKKRQNKEVINFHEQLRIDLKARLERSFVVAPLSNIHCHFAALFVNKNACLIVIRLS